MTTVELARQQLLIGGDWREAGSGRDYQQSFPFTGSPVGRAAAAGREEARAAADAAGAAFPEWSGSAPAMRRSILSKAADLLMERQQPIAGIVTEETGGRCLLGDPREATTAIGPLINAAAMERVTGLVRDAVAKGAEALSGGEPDGACFPPTVLAGVTPEMRVYSEESFGPLLAVVAVDGPDEAVRVANDSDYGLSAAVFSENVPGALELAPADRERHLPHQRHHRARRAPDAVRRRQGELLRPLRGRAALEEFTELRWITVQERPRQHPI